MHLPELDRDAAQTLSEQIAEHFRRAIHERVLSGGERLPPIREVAAAAGVTRTTVQTAYAQLAEDGLVTATVGRGTVVALADGEPSVLSPFADAALNFLRRTADLPELPPGQQLIADFAELLPQSDWLPFAELRECFDRVLRERGVELLGYGPANGLPELRELLAARARELEPGATADDFLVTSGAQQGLDLVLRTFAGPGAAVVVPVPTYHQLFGLLRAHGMQAVPVPADAEGIDLDALARALQRPDVRLLYLMPTFHNPTGRTLDRAQREALMEIVADTRVPVVEDEYQQLLRFNGEPLPSLRAFDPRGLCVTLRSFSKGLFPGLRTGIVQAGPALLQPMTAVKGFADLETSTLLQMVLVEFMRLGHFDRHLERVRHELRQRHAAARKACAAQLPSGCTISAPDGGFLTWIDTGRDGAGDRLSEAAAARGVRTVPGRMFEPQAQPSRGLRLSLARADAAHIDAGIRILGQCAHQILNERPDPRARSRIVV